MSIHMSYTIIIPSPSFLIYPMNRVMSRQRVNGTAPSHHVVAVLDQFLLHVQPPLFLPRHYHACQISRLSSTFPSFLPRSTCAFVCTHSPCD
ncbi:unnamed protein product [Periconia digitata]|uniref:Uncharacterized protein n=1 Tax=Periconia digitata TaxID=1303443 RepID=A0A9W4UU18_9PLEO|nr:unnamed protein product [Periconia digitata]